MSENTKGAPRTGTGGAAAPLSLLFWLSPFAAGLFYEPLSALASLFLLVWLLLRARRGGLAVPKDPLFLSTALIAVFYALGAFWAVDRGMAALGFVKFLPLPLFVLAAAQTAPSEREAMLRGLPVCGAVMAALSGALSLVPGLSGLFLVNGRLSGFFAYPNTFALYELLGAAVLAGRERWRGGDAVCLAALLLGISLSGSRTVLFLLLGMIAALAIVTKNRRRCLLLLGMAAAAALLTAAVGSSAAGRVLSPETGGSTFYGRLLYYRDALPVILAHPLGLGYMGYSFLQGSFQTGVYSVAHIHNDLMQLLLDVGWLPAGFFVYAAARRFFARDCGLTRRLVIALMSAHALFDFDLQFVAMDFILLLALTPEETAARPLKHPALTAACGALAAACLYFGAASGLYCAVSPSAAVRLYPSYTQAWLDLLPEAETVADMERIADEILSRNDAVSLAHSARARAAFARGDIEEMIAQKRRAIALARYDLGVYLDYLDMLFTSVRLYEAAGDAASAEYCRQCAREVPAMLQEALDDTSALGRRISDQPELTLPAEYIEMLAAM